MSLCIYGLVRFFSGSKDSLLKVKHVLFQDTSVLPLQVNIYRLSTE